MTRQFDDDEQALSRALHGRVDRLSESPLGLGDVQTKARAVRRRRQLAAGAAVAAAVAVIVPTAVVATRDLDGGRDPGPATATASVTPTEATDNPEPSPTDSAEPTEGTGRQPFDLSALEVGDAPKIEWAAGSDVHRADGSTVAGVLPSETIGFAPLGDGWVVATRDEEGATFARFLPADGMSAQVLFELDGSLATSPMGEVVAFAQPDGQVKVMQRDGAEQFYLAPINAPGAYDAVAVSSEDCKEGRTTVAGCSVYVNTKGEQLEARFTSSHGIVDLVDGEIDEMTAWSPDRYAGIIERRDDLSTCSVVRSIETRETLWETCDNRIMEFSPTGASAFGVGSVGDGIGDGQVTLLDATDGTVLVDMASDEQHPVFAAQWAWEDDSHVLLVVHERGEWSVVRLGTDGSMEFAVEPRKGDELEPAFVLQS